jgi:hypothetical protein
MHLSLGPQAVDAFYGLGADRIIAEKNFGASSWKRQSVRSTRMCLCAPFMQYDGAAGCRRCYEHRRWPASRSAGQGTV